LGATVSARNLAPKALAHGVEADMVEPFVLALVVVVVLLATLALFTRGGPSETLRNVRPGLPQYSQGELTVLARSMLEDLGLRVTAVEEHAGGKTDLEAANPAPIVGQRVYVRTFAGTQPVGAPEIQAALDRLTGDSFNKALLIAPAGFSDEAVLAANESAVELIDAARLHSLMSLSAPQQATNRPQQA
jgi:hypothetical protein